MNHKKSNYFLFLLKLSVSALSFCGFYFISQGAIDREALVTRHNPSLTHLDIRSPFTLGNGAFAFTADITGLQTLGSEYEKEGIPTLTMARWAWHTDPNPENYILSDAYEFIDTHGVKVPYPTKGSSKAGAWLRKNPHDVALSQITFVDNQGNRLSADAITAIHQELNLWTGLLQSDFTWHGYKTHVDTVVDSKTDTVSFKIKSEAIALGLLRIALVFPKGFPSAMVNNPPLEWDETGHTTRMIDQSNTSLSLERLRDDTHYYVTTHWSSGSVVKKQNALHEFIFSSAKSNDTFEISVNYNLTHTQSPPSYTESKINTELFWKSYWNQGACVDFTGSTDPRAFELERRIILSEYLTAAQFKGEVPPCETGLTCSSWVGKHNTEMVWWHVAHFALWGHADYTANALEWFNHHIKEAKELAQSRGLSGARWPKMIGIDDRECPGGNPLIIWNQPHPIALAELLYRDNPSEETLKHWSTLVTETAECISSMLFWDDATKRYILGPPVWIAQEIYDQKKSSNPTYELSYWAYALEVAQTWRERQHLARNPDWDNKIKHLSELPVSEGRYVAIESIPDTWTNIQSRHDHPSFLMAYGVLPGVNVDKATMRNTLDGVLTQWQWNTKIWGWDYPMIAMTATRLGEADKAIDILLKDSPGNAYEVNGNCWQRQSLPLYLPANGSLLSAVALMVGGYDGSIEQPGIPKNGKWVVKSEGLKRLP